MSASSISEATSGTELPAVAAPDEEAPAVPPAVLSRRLTLQIYTDLEEKSEKTAWLRPRLLLGAVSFTLCVFGGLLQNDPAIFVGADFVTMQNPSFAFSKDTLLNIFGEIVAVPSAAVFSTVLLLTLLEVYAEKLGFPLLNSDARNIADGRAFVKMLKKSSEVFWDTRDDAWGEYLKRERGPLKQLARLNVPRLQSQQWYGGINQLDRFHFTIVRGEGWQR